jgi:hypothetical protein
VEVGMPKKTRLKPKRKKVTYYLDPASLAAVESLVTRYRAASASEALRHALPQFDRNFDYLSKQGKLTYAE